MANSAQGIQLRIGGVGIEGEGVKDRPTWGERDTCELSWAPKK